MSIIINQGYSYQDLTIMPPAVSNIKSRKDCNPFYTENFSIISSRFNQYLPIFTAPMTCVVDENNFSEFDKNGIIPMLPRSVAIELRQRAMMVGTWIAMGLNEFKEYFIDSDHEIEFPHRVCIDVANGHMSILHEMIRTAKERHGDNLIIMAGNIANPGTYLRLCSAGCDYVRLGIGSGACCITTSNTGIHYPIASLIDGCKKAKTDARSRGNKPAKIVADGGIKGFSDVIKAIALGADYVMIGSLFGAFFDSAAPFTSLGMLDKYDTEAFMRKMMIDRSSIPHDTQIELMYRYNLEKTIYGMSTRRAQLELGGSGTKTSEGIEKNVKVTTNIRQWSLNMISYLKSAMSYCNATDLDDFKCQDLIVNSASEQYRVNS